MDLTPFPRIESLDDVLPHVSYERGHVVLRRDDHTIVDYVYNTPLTFATPIAREARGLKFDCDGRIIARPFHKFFVLGEWEQPDDIDWTRPHTLLEKLDGTMIHGVVLAGDLRFMTTMGLTPQAAMAEAAIGEPQRALARHVLAAGMTPVFEFTGPENRIVVAYDRPAVTMLAVREMIGGHYLPDPELRHLGERFDVPVVARLDVGDTRRHITEARAQQGIEGFVVVFDDGHRIKVKTDAYALRHKALAGLGLEKNVLALVAAGAVDDVVPLLSPRAAEALQAYNAGVLAAIGRQADMIRRFVEERSHLDRKTFAEAVRALDARLRPVAFEARDGRDPHRRMLKLLADASQSETRIEALRDLLCVRWDARAAGLEGIDA